MHIVADQVLFGAEQADLRGEGKTVLDALAPTLAGLPNELKVEGHTNSLPVTPGGPYPSNWELSTARATTVLRYLIETDGLDQDRMQAAGFAATRPLLPDTDPTSVIGQPPGGRRRPLHRLRRGQFPAAGARRPRPPPHPSAPTTPEESTP